MPWIRFTQPFQFRVKEKPAVIIAYKAGGVHLVKQACAAEAIESGKAVEIERPKPDESALMNWLNRGGRNA